MESRYNVNQPAKRSRGRPKGSKNRNRILSGTRVEEVCDRHKFNPTAFLVAVANGTDDSESWTKDDRLRAATKLHDSIHHNKAVGAEAEPIDGQYEIIFVEDTEAFTLPGATNAAGAEEAMRAEQIQRTGDSSQGWQDSIRD